MNIGDLKSKGKDFSVLYAEDDDMLRGKFGSFLRRIFKEVDECENGKIALEAYKNKKYDLVLTDMEMPEMDGIEMAKNIKELNKGQVFVFVTAYNEQQKIDDIETLENCFYVFKPIEYDIFFEVLDKAINSIPRKKTTREVDLILETKNYSSYLNVLYVEDEEQIRHKYVDFLSKFFKSIDEASNGEEAMKLYKSKNYDILITDIRMPKMDGFELIDAVKSINPSQPVVVVTAFDDKETLSTAIKLGVNGFLSKPIDFIDGLKVIRDVSKMKFIFNENEKYKHNLEEAVDKKTRELLSSYKKDSFSGLPNRNALIDEMESSRIDALGIFKIKNFKEINEHFGHFIGDKLIIHVASMLGEFQQEEKIKNFKIYRLEGVKYAISFRCEDQNQETNIHQKYIETFNKIINTIENEPFMVANKEISFEIYASYASYLDREDIYKNAELALLEAKRKDRKIIFYDTELSINKEIKENLFWIGEVKKALADNRVKPYVQPIIDNKTGEIYKYEVLARMILEDGSLASPLSFLKAVKKTSVYDSITKVMFDYACDKSIQIGKSFSVNVSYRDFENSQTVGYFIQKLENHPKPQNITFEILESEHIASYDTLKDFCRRVKALGAKIAIDDFGSGYSNFEHVSHLEADYIKIDGSLIKNIKDDKRHCDIAETIIIFADKIGSKTIAEFVSDEKISDLVNLMKADYSQGYFISPPIPGDSI